MKPSATPSPIDDLALLIGNAKLNRYPEEYDKLLLNLFEAGAKAFGAYSERKQKEEQEKEQALKPFLELLDNLAQGDPVPLRQALIKGNIETLDLSRKLNAYVDPAFYSILVSALTGTPVKTLLINHNSISSDCINRFIPGLPSTNLTTFQFIGAVVNDESATLLAHAMPKTALTSIDFNYNKVSAETDRLIHSFKGLNLVKSKIISMMDELKAASDEEVLRLMEGIEFSSEFCSTKDSICHLRLYLELVTPQIGFAIAEAQDPAKTHKRKYSS